VKSMQTIISIISTLDEDRVGYLKLKSDEMLQVVGERLFIHRTSDLRSLSSGFLVILT
jgi:hypothetical protein